MAGYRGEAGSRYPCGLWDRLINRTRVGGVLSYNFFQLLRGFKYNYSRLSPSGTFGDCLWAVCGARGTLDLEPAMPINSLSIKDKIIPHIFDDSLVLGFCIS